jgi:hypothetical protein
MEAKTMRDAGTGRDRGVHAAGVAGFAVAIEVGGRAALSCSRCVGMGRSWCTLNEAIPIGPHRERGRRLAGPQASALSTCAGSATGSVMPRLPAGLPGRMVAEYVVASALQPR